MFWGANRNITKAIVKSFPAYRKRIGARSASSRKRERGGPVVKRKGSAWSRIRSKDAARHRLLLSPVRWFLVLTLGFLMIEALASASALGMVSVFLIGLLWGSAFANTPSFRVMSSLVLVTSSAAFGLYGVELLRVVTMTALAMILTILALRSLPRSRSDEEEEEEEPTRTGADDPDG